MRRTFTCRHDIGWYPSAEGLRFQDLRDRRPAIFAPSGDIRRSISNLAMTSWNHFGARRAKSSNFLRAANASIRVLVGAEEKPA